jgi:hypothetical protein
VFVTDRCGNHLAAKRESPWLGASMPNFLLGCDGDVDHFIILINDNNRDREARLVSLYVVGESFARAAAGAYGGHAAVRTDRDDDERQPHPFAHALCEDFRHYCVEIAVRQRHGHNIPPGRVRDDRARQWPGQLNVRAC